jgi:hypothetical protein
MIRSPGDLGGPVRATHVCKAKRLLTSTLVSFAVACSGDVKTSNGGNAAKHTGAPGSAGQGQSGAGALAGNAGAGGSKAGGPGPITVTATPFDMQTALSAARKVKNLLTGLPANDADVAKLTQSGAAGLQELISTWVTDPMYQASFRDKMLVFFRNAFQQTGFTPTEDFKPQLLENGGFDFGPFGANAVGDDAFALLVQNLKDSFAVTAWQLVSEGQPFSEVLTTQRYMLTTGLKSLYLQIEMPNDQPFAFSNRFSNAMPLAWKVDYSGNPIPLEDSLNPRSPNFMVFDDQAPVNPGNGFRGGTMFQTCRGGTATDMNGAAVTSATLNGTAQLFQRMLGFTPRFPYSAMPTCWEHASKPYFTQLDMNDWQWVRVRALQDGEAYLRPYDLPALRKTTELALKLPRVGFYTTPAFLALWNTNDSNQHRVTANQTLLVALGASLSSENTIVPLSTAGLDSAHAVDGSECYGCHKTLDPLRQFWGNQLDFNDRNDFPTRGFKMTAPNPRPSTLGGVLAFADVNTAGANMLELGPLLAHASDGATTQPLNLFASAMAQKLCYYANSVACDAGDPELRRVVLAFQNGNFNFLTLIKELFASPLVTGALPTQTFAKDTLPPSISRRDHFCAALSNRLGRPDLCAQAVSLPTPQQTATAKIAASVAADAFSRGSEAPITPADPTLFYRAATEMLCENIATQVVDGMADSVYSSTSSASAIPDMVDKVMGYPPSDPKHGPALQILMAHYSAVLAQNRNMATPALRSTFVLACESPSAVSVGL